MRQESELRTIAKRFFRLELPTTEAQLKSAYRREANKLHPDRPGGSEEAFKRMQQAYDALKAVPMVLTGEASREVVETMEGIPLSELGLGINDGKLCETCTGRGYTTVSDETRYQRCRYCRGTGVSVACSKCRGSGRTKLKKLCPTCEGVGFISITSTFLDQLGASKIRFICGGCNGMGGFRTNKVIYRHYKCGDCNGKGETPMFNPLIPKNRMAR